MSSPIMLTSGTMARKIEETVGNVNTDKEVEEIIEYCQEIQNRSDRGYS